MILSSFLTAVLLLLPAIFFIICLYYASYFLKAARHLENTPTSKIRSAAQGYVEISGTLKPLQTLHSYCSQEPCVWYQYSIEVLKTVYNGKTTSRTWQLIEKNQSASPFLVMDETGDCVFLPSHATIYTRCQQSWVGLTQKPSPRPNTFWNKLVTYFFGRYRYTETVLKEGDSVFASGMFYTKTPDQEPQLQDPILNEYLSHKSSTHFLSHEGLNSNEHLILSALQEKKLTQQLKIKSLVFLIVAFALFGAACKTIPIFTKAITDDWRHMLTSAPFRYR